MLTLRDYPKVSLSSCCALVIDGSDRSPIGLIDLLGDRSIAEWQADDVAWARALESGVPGAEAALLGASRVRTALRAAASGEVIRLGRAGLRIRGGWRWVPALTTQLVAISGARAQRLVKERVRS